MFLHDSDLLQYVKSFLYLLDLSNTDLNRIDLSFASLSGAHLSGAIATPEQFAGAEGVTPEQLAQIKSSKPAVYK